MRFLQVIGAVALLSIIVLPIGSRPADVAVLLPGEVEFFDIQRKAIEDHAKDMGLTVHFYNAKWDAHQQHRQLENVATARYDVIALCSVLPDAMHDAPRIAGDSALLTFTNAIGGDSRGRFKGVRAHIGRDEIAAGRLLGDLVFRCVGDRPVRIGLVEGASGTAPQVQRTAGFAEVARKHLNWKIAWIKSIRDWSEKEAARDIDDTALQVVDVVATQWALAADVISRQNSDGRIEIVTLENTQETQKGLRTGKVRFATEIEIEREGRLVIDVAHAILQGEPVNHFYETHHVVLDGKDLVQKAKD